MRDDREAGRFEIEENGLVVFAAYRRRGDVVALTHVEAAPALRGTGAADRLMRAVSERARAEGFKIVPYCGYAAAWLRRHGEFADVCG